MLHRGNVSNIVVCESTDFLVEVECSYNQKENPVLKKKGQEKQMNKRNGGGMIMELSYYASDCKIKNVAFRTRPRLFAVKLQRQN